MAREVELDVSRLVVDKSGVQGFVWPVARHEVLAMRDAMLSPLMATAFNHGTGAGESARLLSMTLGSFVGETMMLYQAFALCRRLGVMGHSPMAGPGGRIVPALAAGRVPQESPVIEFLHRGPKPSRNRARAAANRLRMFLRFNGPSPSILRPTDPARDIVANQSTGLLLWHARAVRDTIRFEPADSWVRPQDRQLRGDSPEPGASTEVIDAAVGAVGAGFAAGNETLTSDLAEYLRGMLEVLTGLADRHLKDVLRTRGNRLPHHLWTGTGGSPWSRIMRHATLLAGGEVTGHDHGTGYGFLVQPHPICIEFESCTRFVTFNDAQAKALTESTEGDVLLGDRPAPLIVTIPRRNGGPMSSRPRLSTASKPAARSSGAQSVMYSSSIYRGEQVRLTPSIPDIVAVDWEARLFGTLQTWGYEVLHKPSPGSIALPYDAFSEKLGVRLLTERFEEVFQAADLLILASPHSTTFAVALASQKPVVFVDFGLDTWVPEAYELLGRRCRIVRGWFDEDNRPQVDWDELHAGLEQCGDLQDPAFSDSYLDFG